METSTSTAAALAAQSGLTLSELQRANSHLWQSRDGVIAAITGLSEAQWHFKPSPDCWSIAEITEHVVFIQGIVLGTVRDRLPAAPPSPAGRNLQLVDALIIDQFPIRTAKFPAPEFAQPKGDWSLTDALDRVTTGTKRLSECLESQPELRRHVLESAPLKAVSKGEYLVMDGYQWILAASAHTERHTHQILEVKAHSGYPAN